MTDPYESLPMPMRNYGKFEFHVGVLKVLSPHLCVTQFASSFCISWPVEEG